MKKCRILICLCMIILLSACTNNVKKFEPDKSSIFINTDKTFMNAVVSNSFDGANSDSFNKFVDDELNAFKRENPNNSVELVSTSLGKDYIKVIFKYNNFDDLKQFAKYSQDNNIKANSIDVYTIDEAKQKMDELNIDLSNVKVSKNSLVVIVDGEADIYLSGKIIAVDGNIVESNDKDHVVCAAGKSVIIFK